MTLTATADLTSGYSGMCLKFVRLSLGAPSAALTALAAWNAARFKHTGDRTPPAGVPVFFTAGSNGAGHVALSIGGGKVRSTDWPHRGQISETTIGAIENAWRRRLLGWTEDLNGARVWAPTSPSPTSTQEATMNIAPDDAQAIAAAVWHFRLGPFEGLNDEAWLNLLDVRLRSHSTSSALADITTQAGGVAVGPAPLSTFVADTRVATMQLLDLARGQAAQIGALTAAVGAIAVGTGADPAALVAVVDKAVADGLARFRATTTIAGS